MLAQHFYRLSFAFILSALSLPAWSLGPNLALPVNGGVITASSTHSPNFPVSGVNNGDRKGANWGNGGGWNDGTASVYPDWLQVNFNGVKNIEAIDLFTVQDNYSNPIEPTVTTSFTQYGLKDFEVQYWNGTSWLTIPGGNVSNNTLVWRKFTFPAISTDRIRIYITNALAGYSRITELEVYEVGGPANVAPNVNLTAPANNASYTAPANITLDATASDTDGSISQVEFYQGSTLLNTDTTAPYSYTWNNVPQGNYSLTARAYDNQGASTDATRINISVNPPIGQAKNLALTSNGGVITASSTYSSNFPVSGVNNGDRKGANWGNGGGWNDGTASQYPDWLQVTFNGMKNINQIDLFTTQDNYTNPIEPSASTSFTQYGLKNFEIQYWNGGAWVTIPGGSISNNTLIWRSFNFNAINTDRIRVYITSALAGYSRITELEVYEAAAPTNIPPTVNLTAPANNASYTAPANITLDATASDSDGNISQVEFYSGTTLLNTDTTAPYSYIWSNVQAGNYSLTARATDNSGASTTSTPVDISVITPAPTVTLSANPSNVASGGSSTLTWTSANATSCTASGAWSGSKATSGNQSTGALTQSSTYTLSCTGVGGTASQSVTVVVTPSGGTSTLSGLVDSSLIANLNQNAVYIYAGDVMPDDLGGTGAQPLGVVSATQDQGACTWRYNAGSLTDGQYTLAFTNQAANDNPATNDAIAFQRTTLINLSGGAMSYNFAPSRVLTVGAGKTYPNVMAAAAAVQNGDVIEIDAGQYNDNIVVWRANDVTLRGVGGRAHIHATKLIPYTPGNDLENGMGLWVTRGSNIKVEHIEFSNAAVPDKNGAGIRAEGANLSVCNANFHHNENGILGGAGEVLIEYSEFAYNGGCPVGYGCAHNLYINNANKLVFRHNYSHHANIGHLLKSRAKENHILYNRLTGETGTASYEVDIPDGGLTYLIGNLIQQGPQTDNSNMVAYAAESASNPLQQLFVVNNTLVNENGSGAAILIRSGTTAQVINNLFVGAGAAVSGSAAQTTNLTSNTPNFVNQAAFDYRLTSTSPGINGGSNPGSNAGFALAPTYQYLHPINRELRSSNGALDIGAYEYTGGTLAPTVSLSANPLSVSSGGISTLTWSSTNSTNCTASGAWSGNKATSGTESTAALSIASTYTLTCIGAGGSASQSVTVNVVAVTPMPTVTLSASPSSISSGGNSTLSWSSSDATSCTASGAWIGNKALSGNQSTGALIATSNFTLACSGAGGTTSRTAIVTVTPAGGNPLDSLQAGHWYAFPNSNMSAVDPCPANNCSYTGYEGQAAVMDDWAGGAYDSSRDRLMVWGGGHMGYGGNEVYAFSIDTGAWSRLTEPSDPVSMCTDFYPDGRPAAAHTYNFLQYIPGIDSFATFSAGQFCPAGGSGALGAVTLDLTSNNWSRRAAYPPVGSHIGAMTAYDPTSGHVWMMATGYAPSYDAATTLYRYDPIANTWTAGDTGNSDLAYPYLTAAIDHTRRKMVAIGGGKLVVWDITNPTRVTRESVVSSGANSIINTPTPGFVYDPVSDRYVAWDGGANVYTLNPTTWVWTLVTPAATNTVTPTAANSRGTFGRFRYIPSKNAFIVVNATTQNVYAYKLNDGVALPPAPTVSISASPLSVNSGSSSTLSWSSSNATSCTASGAWSGVKAITGAESTNPLSVASTYTLSCTGAGGSASQSVTVGVSTMATPTVTLTANPASVSSGSSSTLSWSSSNAIACSASGAWTGSKPTSGSEPTGALNTTSNYSLTCTGTGGSTSQTVTVSVSAPPPVGLITSLNVVSNSNNSQSNVPITFGHAFKAGDLPTGAGLSAKLGDGTTVPMQLDIKATHSDGSLRHGIITLDLPTLAAGATQLVQLSSASSSNGAAIQLSQLLATSFDAIASLKVGAATYTASARNLLQTTTPKVWLSGPLVSEWLVGGPVKDGAGNAHPHLAAYFHIRAYAGLDRARVDMVIENNWTKVANPQDFTYDVNLTVGGVPAYSKAALTHYHHARWHKVGWWGTQPQVTVLHDIPYLQNSKAVSKYATLTPSQSYLNSMLSSLEPMQNGNLTAYMPSTGAQDGIGPLPRWVAAYLVSGDARAKTATMLNGDAGGSYSIHYRDETTGYPISIAQHPNLSEQNNSLPNVVSSSQPLTHDDAHQPSIGYVPYLLSGDYFYLEELQFWATWNLVFINDAYRQYEKGLLAGQTRSQAWSLRELGRAAAVTPDVHPLKDYFNIILMNNLTDANAKHANNPSASPLGIMLDYYDGYTNVALWQHDFFSWTYGHLVELGFSHAQTMRDWTAKFPVGRMGQSATEYCYVYAAPYRLSVGPNDTATYPDFRSWYQALWPTESQTACPTPTPNNMIGYSDDASGYPSNMRPALAISVDAGMPGALNAWNRLLIGSQPNYNDAPQWAVAPR